MPLSCSVTSSEKVDKAQRYADFTLLSIPYPGRRTGSNFLCFGVLRTVWEELYQAAWTFGPRSQQSCLRVRQYPAELYICPRSDGQRWDLVLVFMSHNLEKVTSLSFRFPQV